MYIAYNNHIVIEKFQQAKKFSWFLIMFELHSTGSKLISQKNLETHGRQYVYILCNKCGNCASAIFVIFTWNAS